MGPKTATLVRLLGEAVDLLERCEEMRWATRLRRNRARLRTGDFRGIADLLSVYGGMGSFNDLVLHPLNGHALADDEIDAANRSLASLRTRIYTLASEIRHEATFTA